MSAALHPALRPLAVRRRPTLAAWAFASLLCGAPAVGAQPAGAATPPEAPAPEGRPPQRVQRIQIEDGGSRVDELRVGGQTQTITVQPKTGTLPAYEVQPADGLRGRAGSFNGAETSTAPRVWNVMKF